MEVFPKPDELLALHSVTGEMFDTLRRWFDVPPTISLNLVSVDSAVAELGDPVPRPACVETLRSPIATSSAVLLSIASCSRSWKLWRSSPGSIGGRNSTRTTPG